MSILIGNKSNIDNGYLYAPYLEGEFSPKIGISKRYGSNNIKKIKKIKKILERIEDFNLTSG